MMKKILILSANPKNTDKLRLDQEVREIKAAIKRANNREQFEIVTSLAIRVEDLRRALLEYQPAIVHFSGHGSGSTGLALENNSGQVQLVSTEPLARLFGLFQDKIECVLLNACYSQTQAEAIHQHIDYVVGMNQAIGDVAAIEFAIGFYDALGAGRSYEDCFEVGCASVDLQGIPESDTPVLKARRRLLRWGEQTSGEQTQPKTNSRDVVLAKSAENNSQPKYYGGISQSLSGGQMYGGMQAVQGDYNQQTMRIKNTASANEKQLTQQQAVHLLVQIEQMVKEFPELPTITKEKSLRYLAASIEEVQSNDPDKQFAAGNLKRMAETLKTISETSASTKGLWENVKAILMQLSTWLGIAQNFFPE
jgi:hypothetical protein